MRSYIAHWDNGHDTGSFKFTSEARSNSKINKEDARRTMIERYGAATKNRAITNIRLAMGSE